VVNGERLAATTVVNLSGQLPGLVTVHSLLSEPGLLLRNADVTYIGRKNGRYEFRQDSPLANRAELKDRKNEKARAEACDLHIRALIKVLQVQSGPTWDELQRLTERSREGKAVKLLCYCHPKRCHGDAIAFVVRSLAVQEPVSEIIAELESLLPEEQFGMF